MSKLILGQSRLVHSQTPQDSEFYSHIWTQSEGSRAPLLVLDKLILSLIIAFTLNSHIVNKGVVWAKYVPKSSMYENTTP